MLLITIQFVSHLVVSAISFPSPQQQQEARQATTRNEVSAVYSSDQRNR